MANTTGTDTNKFKEAGISFSRIPPDRTQEVLQFLAVNFFPEEPICRSLKVERNWIVDMVFRDPVKAGNCVMATDVSGKIIGVRLVKVVCRSDWFEKWADKVLYKVTWMGGSTLARAAKVTQILNERVRCLGGV